jgi:hypothetical protein
VRGCHTRLHKTLICLLGKKLDERPFVNFPDRRVALVIQE